MVCRVDPCSWRHSRNIPNEQHLGVATSIIVSNHPLLTPNDLHLVRPRVPRWLVSRDRSEEAFDILAKYHAEGNRQDPFVIAEFNQIRETIHLEKEASSFSWLELVKSRGNVHRLMIAASLGLFTQWSGNGLVSYYLAQVLKTIGIEDSRRQNQINLGLQCWNLVSGVSGAFIAKYLRRRWQYLTAFGGMTVVFACWTAASATFAENGNHNAASAVVAMIFIYYGFYNLMHPMTYIYITEVFPFISRSKGVALTQLFSRRGEFLQPVRQPDRAEQPRVEVLPRLQYLVGL